MEATKEYILAVAAISVFCGIMLQLVDKSGSKYTVFKLILGMVFLITVLKPLLRFDIPDMPGLIYDYREQALAAAGYGTVEAEKAAAESIKAMLESYILDKAKVLGLDVSVTVTLSEGQLPETVRIDGAVDPESRKELERILTGDLGISGEKLQWNN